MRVVLEIAPGSVAPRSVTIAAGPEVRVGRTAPANVVLDDQTVSRQHFAIAWDGRTCRMRDLGSTHGTFVNGERVKDAVLYDGDMIEAGTTRLRVRFTRDERIDSRHSPLVAEGIGSADPTSSSAATLDIPLQFPTLHDRLIEELRAQKEPLYAILDAAREPLVLARVVGCEEEHQSLYEGAGGARLAEYAPYLVALPRGSLFLERIVRDGWGKSWGIYLTCSQPFQEIRKQLRRLLMVRLDGGKQVYFRFYDPRVLQVFLPTCTQEELTEFFGPCQNFLMEGSEPDTFVQFGMISGRLSQSTTRLCAPQDLARNLTRQAVH
jgi:Domain of unknown function (DUF4123)/FHA domain